MKICSNCGAQGSGSFCTNCGGSMIEVYGDNSNSSPMVSSTQNQDQNSSSLNYSTPNNSLNNSQRVYSQSYSNSSPASYKQPSLYQSSLKNDSIVPVNYQPISPVGYFGYSLLFGIPFIGFIALLIMAFGGTTNINLRNYARGMLISQVILCGIMLYLYFFYNGNSKLL